MVATDGTPVTTDGTPVTTDDTFTVRVGGPDLDEGIAQQLGITVEELRRPLMLQELWQVYRPAESQAEKLHRETLYARLAVQARVRRELP